MGKSSNFGLNSKEGMDFIKSVGGVHQPSSSPLQKDKGSVDVAFYFIWSILGVSLFGKGNPLGVEQIFCG